MALQTDVTRIPPIDVRIPPKPVVVVESGKGGRRLKLFVLCVILTMLSFAAGFFLRPYLLPTEAGPFDHLPLIVEEPLREPFVRFAEKLMKQYRNDPSVQPKVWGNSTTTFSVGEPTYYAYSDTFEGFIGTIEFDQIDSQTETSYRSRDHRRRWRIQFSHSGRHFVLKSVVRNNPQVSGYSSDSQKMVEDNSTDFAIFFRLTQALNEQSQ